MFDEGNNRQFKRSGGVFDDIRKNETRPGNIHQNNANSRSNSPLRPTSDFEGGGTGTTVVVGVVVGDQLYGMGYSAPPLPDNKIQYFLHAFRLVQYI
jgi:hypothetical protein